jgi:hypothetical protein
MVENRQIFLCHASEDKAAVRAVYHELRTHGFDPWLDSENLLPGQDWEREIRRAIRESAAVVVFLSRTSVRKRGYVQNEFRLAMETLREIPDGQIFVIPLKLDDCEVPEIFRHLHWSAADDAGAVDRLIKSLRKCFPGTSPADELALGRGVGVGPSNADVSGSANSRGSRSKHLKVRRLAFGETPSAKCAVNMGRMLPIG